LSSNKLKYRTTTFLATSPQCRCVNTSRSPMSSQHCKSLQIFPPTAHCRNTEILITLKNGNTVCVDPEVDWIKRIIEKVLKRRYVPNTKNTVS
uniref:Chemokine interleukin-8-like domain-containing protein n=1 Tax=Astyanax mexicanus TaxID=7994 RepID=A0A8B9J7I6_ASTMX